MTKDTETVLTTAENPRTWLLVQDFRAFSEYLQANTTRRSRPHFLIRVSSSSFQPFLILVADYPYMTTTKNALFDVKTMDLPTSE